MKRSYKQNCALALASDLLCERWTLLIFRELLIRPCRFKDLNAVLIGMGTNLLTNRLKELEQAELIEKVSPDDKRSPYGLTPRGWEVEPLILQLIRWGHTHLTGSDEFTHQHHWDLLAMKALFNPEKFQKEFTLQFTCPTFTGWFEVSKKGVRIGLGEANHSDMVIPSNIQTFQQSIQKKELASNTALMEFIAAFEI